MVKCDFSGWATRNDLVCGDGLVIKKDAFKHNDGKRVSLIWNHDHGNPEAVLGHAILENRDEGVYAYCYFNESENGKLAKQLVQHGDVSSLSIWANKLRKNGRDVLHGEIRELSLVLAGANPGAYIDVVMAHSEDGEDASELYANYNENIMIHSADAEDKKESDKEDNMAEEKKETEQTEKSDKTVGEVWEDILKKTTEEEQNVIYGMIDTALGARAAVDEETDDEDEEDENMKHNVFDNEEKQEQGVLSHSEMQAVIADGKRYGSMRESFLAHGVETEYSPGTATYGIDGAEDFLFPDARNLNTPPSFISREMGWVKKVMNGTHHTPFSRIKSMFANITEDEARAKGYIKGKLKKEEVFTLLKRTTTPTTIYKKQKMDRDDVNDITDFDVIAWLKSEMRLMLDEEIARAILVGDGRLSSSDDKINEQNIRPIWTDEDLFTIKALVNLAANATADDKCKAFIRAAIKARKNYKGSGNPVMFTTEDVLTDCLLMEDGIGHLLYPSVEKLANVLRVKEIITVPVMEGLTREVEGKNHELMGLIVNLNDYNVGADKGGAVNMFDDFDIDYNQQKYLIETRCSGALIKPYSAIAVECVQA